MGFHHRDLAQPGIFSYISLEERLPAGHPLRAIRPRVDGILRSLSRRFDALSARTGRPSIPPERLLGALLLGWFVGLRMPKGSLTASRTAKAASGC